MDFNALNAYIPRGVEGKLHSQKTIIQDQCVRVGQPGKYGPGDFVVEVNDPCGWKWRKFRHDHLFKDVEEKVKANRLFMQTRFAPALANTIFGQPAPVLEKQLPGLNLYTLLLASQTLAVAEHRRYAAFEAQGGGRFLPARFSMGIIFGRWDAECAAGVMYQGLPGLKKIIGKYGEPPTLHSFKDD